MGDDVYFDRVYVPCWQRLTVTALILNRGVSGWFGLACQLRSRPAGLKVIFYYF